MKLKLACGPVLIVVRRKPTPRYYLVCPNFAAVAVESLAEFDRVLPIFHGVVHPPAPQPHSDAPLSPPRE